MVKISILTGSRAEYGLLEPLIDLMFKDKDIEPSLIVCGSHLSHEFGYTVDDIKFPIAARVEHVLSSDTSIGICKSFGLAAISVCETLEKLQPDALVVLGDRYEALSVAVAAHISRVPVIHISGGELTFGIYDNAFRHSITQLSQLHFVAAEPYRQRVIQLGQHPSTVFNVGHIGCDGLEKVSDKVNRFVIGVFHPETLSKDQQVANAIDDAMFDLHYDFAFIGGGNDLDRSKFKYSEAHESLPRGEFINLLKMVDCIIGNSSSGILEAPALGTPTINIGDRQRGRLMADSIIQAEPTKESVLEAFDTLYSKEFQELMRSDYKIYYQGGNVAEKILRQIKRSMPLEIKKEFYDLATS